MKMLRWIDLIWSVDSYNYVIYKIKKLQQVESKERSKGNEAIWNVVHQFLANDMIQAYQTKNINYLQSQATNTLNHHVLECDTFSIS